MMREAITCHPEAVIRGSSIVSGRQSSEVRQWSPGGAPEPRVPRAAAAACPARSPDEESNHMMREAHHVMREAIT